MVRTPRLSLLRAQVRSLIGVLITLKLGSTAKKKKKKIRVILLQHVGCGCRRERADETGSWDVKWVGY